MTWWCYERQSGKPNGLETGTSPGGLTQKKPKDLRAGKSEERGHGEGGVLYGMVLCSCRRDDGIELGIHAYQLEKGSCEVWIQVDWM